MRLAAEQIHGIEFAGARSRQSREQKARLARRQRTFFDPLFFSNRVKIRLAMRFPFFFPLALSPSRGLVSGVAIIVAIVITAVFVIWLSLLHAVTVNHCRRVAVFRRGPRRSFGRVRRADVNAGSSRCQHFTIRWFCVARKDLRPCEIQVGNGSSLFRTWHGLV